MPKKKKITTKAKVEVVTKSSVEGFRGGMRLDLDRKMKDHSGQTLREVLVNHFVDVLEQEIENQAPRLKKIRKWNKMYRGERDPKSSPWVNCFSKDTEVLSDGGWTLVSDVRVGERLLSMNPIGGESGYRAVTEKSCTYHGVLKHIYNETVDFMVTPDHKMAVYKGESKSEFKFVLASDLNAGHKIPLVSQWKGKNADLIFGLSPLDAVSFLGWYIAEGWTFKSGTIGIAQKDKAHRYTIHKLLNRLGFKYSSSSKGFLVSAKSVPLQFRRLLKRLGKSEDKYIPRFFLDLESEYLIELLDALLAGDGHIRFRYDRNFPKAAYFTTSKQLADDVQELAQKIGLRASIKIEDKRGQICVSDRFRLGVIRKKLYRIYILFKKQAKISRTQVDDIGYNDFAYNFTVPPYHSVYVRRNGKAAWCGQCANVAIPVSRSNADAISVRVIEAIWGKTKMALFKAMDGRLVGLDKEMEDWFNWYQKSILDFQGKLLSPVLQCVNTGTGLVKLDWLIKRRTVYRYANADEVDNKNIPKYPIYKSETPGIKEVITENNGPQIYPLDREDFIISSDARSIQDAYIVGFQNRMRKPQIRLKETQGLYFKGTTNNIFPQSEEDETIKAKVKSESKELEYVVDESKPIRIWELWVRFDVDEDGEEDDIVLTIHKESNTICDAIYNPIFKGFRPFIDYVFYPSEYHFDGEGAMEILEKPQIELDGLHNRRLDRLTMLNCPETFIKQGSGIDDYKRSPGKVTVVRGELETSIKELEAHDIYPSTFREEDMLASYMDRAVGITPAVMGISTAERPVARETFALQQEANKKFAFGINNIVRRISDTIYMLLEMMAQYQPEYRYKVRQGEEFQEKTVNFPGWMVRDSLQIECIAASAMLNQEVRREKELTLYQLLSDYYTKTAGMVQAVCDPSLPPDFKKFLISVVEKGDRRIEKILDDFDERDSEQYLVNINEVIDVDANLNPPPPPQMPPGQPPTMPGGQQGGGRM